MSQTMREKYTGKPPPLALGGDDGGEQCRQLEAHILTCIPLARAMQLQVVKIDDNGGLHLTAPLQPNINDKGSAFGGAISSMLMLAGWGWMQLANQSVGISRNVVIQRSQGRYKLPCSDALSVVCPAPDERPWQRYLHSYRKFSRARLRLEPLLLRADGAVASGMIAEYVATDPDYVNHHA